jgi:hypothetical protein
MCAKCYDDYAAALVPVPPSVTTSYVHYRSNSSLCYAALQEVEQSCTNGAVLRPVATGRLPWPWRDAEGQQRWNPQALFVTRSPTSSVGARTCDSSKPGPAVLVHNADLIRGAPHGLPSTAITTSAKGQFGLACGGLSGQPGADHRVHRRP